MADVIKATTVGGEPAAISLPLQFRRAWRFSRLGASFFVESLRE